MKKIICILTVITIFIFMVGCSIYDVETDTTPKTSMFVLLESTDIWRIVYHKETRVMYAVSCGLRNCGTFMILVNADGSPMIYEG